MKIKNNLLFSLFLILFGLLGGYFTSLYSVEILSEDLLEETLAQGGF